MDKPHPPLPHLLGILIPNSQPESSSRRPITSNTVRSGTTFNSPDMPNSAKTANNPWSQTQNSFRQMTPVAEKASQNFCFSTFRSPQKALPRLYSGPQQEMIANKFNNLKQRYQRLYKRVDGEEDQVEGVTEENLKEVYLEAEKMFNATYSVKYFGIQGDELGIASKRVPMNTSVNNYSIPSGVGKSRVLRKDVSVQDHLGMVEERNQVSRQGHRENSLAKNSKEMMKSSPDIRKNVYDATLAKKLEGFALEDRPPTGENEQRMKPVESKGNGLGASYHAAKFRHGKAGSTSNLERIAATHPDEIEELDSERHDDTFASARGVKNSVPAQSTARTQIQSRAGTRNGRNPIGVERDLYVVTQYMIPKKLQAVKKSKVGNVSAGQSQQQWLSKNESKKNLEKKASSQKAIQEQYEKEIALQGYSLSTQSSPKKPVGDKRVASMEKVKRSLLRNVHVEKAWEAKPFKDELDVPEKFRTYEVKKIMSDNAKYSYAKLLGTMHTNERPETALVENTEKMERILAVRDEKKKFLGPRGGKSGEFEEVDKRDAQGNYIVKVWYPRENELFNRFWKIKSNVANEEEQ